MSDSRGLLRSGPRDSLCYPDALWNGLVKGAAPRTRSSLSMPFINGFGPLELVIILVIALIVVGPGRLPDVGAALGKSIREFRKAATDVKDATSLDPAKPETAAPAPPAAAVAAVSTAAPPPVAAPPPAPSVVDAQLPFASEAVAPVEAAAPDVSELPEPAPVADGQPTRTA